jgi:hypothetical protein
MNIEITSGGELEENEKADIIIDHLSRSVLDQTESFK